MICYLVRHGQDDDTIRGAGVIQNSPKPVLSK